MCACLFTPPSLLTTVFGPKLAYPVVRVFAMATMLVGSCSNLGSRRCAFSLTAHLVVSVVLMSQGRNA